MGTRERVADFTSGLARPIVTQQHEDLPLVHRERQAVDCDLLAIRRVECLPQLVHGHAAPRRLLEDMRVDRLKVLIVRASGRVPVALLRVAGREGHPGLQLALGLASARAETRRDPLAREEHRAPHSELPRQHLLQVQPAHAVQHGVDYHHEQHRAERQTIRRLVHVAPVHPNLRLFNDGMKFCRSP